jgi:predicted DNA-binding protein with PD1-like motif
MALLKGEINMRTYALRLKPKEDLKKEIIKFTETNNIAAGIILTCVGSLSNVNIRLADEDKSLSLGEKFEILSLTGTLSKDGVHMHISIANSEGRVVGGHLLDGCIIYTTAEIVIGEIEDMIFSRRYSSDTGFKELDIAASPRVT